MGVYATVQALESYVQDNLEVVAPDGDTAERLIARAETDVDRALGPYTLQPSGLKLDPEDLPATQAQALSRATCAAAEFRLQIGESALVGEGDYLPVELNIVRRAPRVSPKILEELAGSGLVTFSGTVTTDATQPEAAVSSSGGSAAPHSGHTTVVPRADAGLSPVQARTAPIRDTRVV